MQPAHFIISILAATWSFVAPVPAADSSPPMRAMWVYRTEPLMESAREQKTLFEFCAKRGITDLFWQCHYENAQNGVRTLRDQAPTRAFLHAAHARALRIHALGGDPSHTLTKNHIRVLAMVDALLAFNEAAGGDDERFDGVHLDIEPHALPQWKTADQAAKCGLLTQLVDIHTKAAARLHDADARLAYGADVVFWLDKTNPDGSPALPVLHHGVTKDAAKHLLDVVDNVGIMSYRNTSGGRNGIIALVKKTIAYADTARSRAFVGVKMADMGPRMETFFGQTEEQMMAELKPIDDTFRPHRGYAGLAFFMWEAFKEMP